jgi:hypothetical protein
MEKYFYNVEKNTTLLIHSHKKALPTAFCYRNFAGYEHRNILRVFDTSLYFVSMGQIFPTVLLDNPKRLYQSATGNFGNFLIVN